jgi:predicted outer membrane protein
MSLRLSNQFRPRAFAQTAPSQPVRLQEKSMSSRRVVLAGLAAAVSLPALAQQPQQNQSIPYSVPTQPTETSPNQGLGSNAQQREQRVQQGGAPQDTQTPARQGQANSGAPGMGQQQSQADRQYIQQTLAAGTVSLQQSNFAQAKAQNPKVKMFAEFEIGEQNTLTDVLHSFSDPSATASTTRGAQQAATTAPELPPEDSAAMERMSRVQGGAAFDRDYVTMQLTGHQKLLAIQEGYLKNASNNREILNVARLAREQIQEHIAQLQDLQKELGR